MITVGAGGFITRVRFGGSITTVWDGVFGFVVVAVSRLGFVVVAMSGLGFVVVAVSGLGFVVVATGGFGFGGAITAAIAARGRGCITGGRLVRLTGLVRSSDGVLTMRSIDIRGRFWSTRRSRGRNGRLSRARRRWLRRRNLIRKFPSPFLAAVQRADLGAQLVGWDIPCQLDVRVV